MANLYLAALFLLCASFLSGSEPDVFYLTWQQDPSTTMTISWFSPVNQKKEPLQFASYTSQEWKTEESSSFSLPGDYPLLLHRVELTALEPAGHYLFRFEKTGQQFHFQTLPAKQPELLRFVEGGDLYFNDLELVKETNQSAAALAPAFALLGGDIAYAEAYYFWQNEKIDRWIAWLKLWKETMVTAGPYPFAIPILSAIGNHDVNGFFGRSPKQAKMFYLLFPTKKDNSGYRLMDVGDYLTLFLLDSGHTHDVGGAQMLWLEESLKSRQQVPFKLAAYHIPAWPSVREPTGIISSSIRKSWVPLFEKYHVDLAFEHHDHAYKRTHPLLAGKIDKKGIVYLGDGGWGVKPRTPKTEKERFYLAKTFSSCNFFVVDLEKTKLFVRAFTPKGELLDQVTINK